MTPLQQPPRKTEQELPESTKSEREYLLSMSTPTDNPEPDKRYCGCCYCGKCWEYEGREPSYELVKEVGDHESVCPKNPYTNRVKELEAEVERLKMRAAAIDNITFDQADRLNECEANLARAIEIAVNLSYDYADTEYDDELDLLKSTISAPNSL